MEVWQAELGMTWGNMISRCYNPKERKYHLYGGRGIKVEDRWHSFMDFVTDMGQRTEGCSLDRIDVNGNYGPENCRWADDETQAKNRRTTVWLTIGGETKCASDWANESGTRVSTITHRIRNGWTHEKAVFGRRFAKRYEGVTHDGINMTVQQWAERAGIPDGTLRLRLKKGMPFEDAISTPHKTRPRKRCIYFSGETMPIEDWARRLSLNPNTIRNRLARGWPVDRALSKLNSTEN